MPSSVFYVHLNQIAKSFYYHSQNFSSIYLPESLRDKEVLRCVFVISCWNYHNSLYSGLSVTSIIRGLQLVQTQVMCEDKQSLEYLIILLQQRGNSACLRVSCRWCLSLYSPRIWQVSEVESSDLLSLIAIFLQENTKH